MAKRLRVLSILVDGFMKSNFVKYAILTFCVIDKKRPKMRAKMNIFILARINVDLIYRLLKI